MNIKHCFFIFLLFNTFSLSAQRTSREGIIEIDYTQLKKGIYHAEAQSDSVYLDILYSKCYYSEFDSKPYKARMYARLTYVSTDKPQIPLEEKPIIIEFDNLDTLPEPRRNEDYIPNLPLEDENPITFIFKRLLPNRLVLQEKDSLQRVLVFNKLKGGYPKFIQIQLDKLKSLAPHVEGIWSNNLNQTAFIAEKPRLDIDYSLLYAPSLNSTGISFSIFKDSIIAKQIHVGIEWVHDSEYIFSNDYSKLNQFKIKSLTDKVLLLYNDSLKTSQNYSKLPKTVFPDSILRGLKNKVWCDTSFNKLYNRIDTLIFDFGGIKDTCNNEDSFLQCEGYSYSASIFHTSIFLRFATFNNHNYFIKMTHGSIRLWEIIDLTPESLTLKGYDEDDKLEIKKYFLHPKNDEFFINGQRTRF